ncbi:MAG: spermidine synthase [Candidatus Eremiobacteraeota bacterium]|nr:spermidine synthase [Candidatus Eremiobacteraeota bacterium]
MRNWWWYIDRIADYEAHMHAIKRTILTDRTPFQEVGIVESAVYGKILLLDGDMQSAERDEFIYHEALVHPGMTSHHGPAKVLILGGGEGACLREVLRHRTVKEVTMIDLDEKLIEICKEYLPEWSKGAYSDPRLTLLFTDAYAWVENNAMLFDLIISDLTEPLPHTPSSGIYSVEYFTILKNRLAKGGALIMQSSRADLIDVRTHSALHRTVKEVFPLVRTYLARIPCFDVVWSYICASESHDPLSVSKEEIDRRIAERVEGELSFYDGETHAGIFHLPKYFRTERLRHEQIMQRGEALAHFNAPVYII